MNKVKKLRHPINSTCKLFLSLYWIYSQCVYLHSLIADRNKPKEENDWQTNIQTYQEKSQSCYHHIYLYYNSPQVCLSVAVSKLQVAIFARSSREMSQIIRIDWQHILSRVCVSVWPRIFYTRKTSKTIANTASHTLLFIWMKQLTVIQCRRKEGVGVNFVMVGRTEQRQPEWWWWWVGVSVCASVCVCVCACVRAWCVCNIR